MLPYSPIEAITPATVIYRKKGMTARIPVHSSSTTGTLNSPVPDLHSMDETSRKVVHLLFGLGLAAAIALIDRPTMLALMVIALFFGFILSDALSRGHHIEGVSPLVEALERKSVLPGKGALLFVFSAFVCLFFFEPKVVVPAVVALAVLDGVATLAGLRYGRHRIFNGKSVEGTGAGIAAAALVLLLVLPPALALAAAVVAGLIELVAPVDDNLLIPPCICLLLTVLS